MLRFQHSQNPAFRVWTLSNFAARWEVGRVLRFQHSRNLPARVSFAVPASVSVATMLLAQQLAQQLARLVRANDHQARGADRTVRSQHAFRGDAERLAQVGCGLGHALLALAGDG